MRLALIVSFLTMLGIGTSALAVEPETTVSANLSWQFGGLESSIPSIGLRADYGSSYGPTMGLADLHWQADRSAKTNFSASLIGLPIIDGSIRSDVTGAQVAKGIGIGTVVVVALVALVFKMFDDAIEACLRNGNDTCSNEDPEGEEEEQPSDEGDGFPTIP